MKKYNIGFIGSGKMAGAIIKGVVKSGFCNPENIIASKSSPENLEVVSKELGVKVILDNKEVTQKSDVVFLGVKPNQIKAVLDEVKAFASGKLFVSLAAGVSSSFIKEILTDSRVIRVMPNTPVLVNEGMVGICEGGTDEDLEFVQSLFDSIGKSVVVEENQIDIVTAISGSGPAFFYKVMNDIARAGEKLGLDYEKALLLSIQTALGSAKMALNREISMEELISNVATKGGCTRVGVDTMIEENAETMFYDVVKNTAKKAEELGK